MKKQIDDEELKRLYIVEKQSYKRIANTLNLSIGVVSSHIRKLGIQRERIEAIKVGGQFRRGDKNPGWKGGRKKTQEGYILVYKPDHPRAIPSKKGYVEEHILVWEETQGRSLPKDWVIHHINGIKSDNRPGNLIAMPRKGHLSSLTVKEVQRRLRKVEAELRKLQAQSRMNI